MEPVSAADEVVDICRDLLRIDTSNTGDPRTTVGDFRAFAGGERAADRGPIFEGTSHAPEW